MRVLALGGSIRAVNQKSRSIIETLVENVSSLAEFKAKAQDQGRDERVRLLSNTEIMAGAALTAAKAAGATVHYFPLARLFGRRDRPLANYSSAPLGLDDQALLTDTLNLNPRAFEQLRGLIDDADGIILSSPVYFGDRSSVANKVLQIAGREGWLQQKVVAMLSCGAKRNGGQETTNIFALNEALALGAFVVGNGEPSAQYGGTAVAGDPGKVLDDHWGMETAFATGKRVTQVSEIITATGDKAAASRPLRVLVLLTMDTPDRLLEGVIGGYAQRFKTELPSVSWDLLPLVDGDIERCLGCGICPIPELLHDPKSYACVIQSRNDTMASVRERLQQADAILVAGLNLTSMQNVVYRYQAFTERTRFIRRNDFELTNIPVAAFTLDEVGGHIGALHAIKVMTSYMRHNTIVCPAVSEVRHEGRTLADGAPAFRDFLARAALVRAGRDRCQAIQVSYKAGGHGGYSDNRLDNTSALRQ